MSASGKAGGDPAGAGPEAASARAASPLAIAGPRNDAVKIRASASVHPIRIRQHVQAHHAEDDQHNHPRHDPHHSHFALVGVVLVLIAHGFPHCLLASIVPPPACHRSSIVPNLTELAYSSLTQSVPQAG